MLTLEEIRTRLRGENIQAVSDTTGLHYNTVRYLKDGSQNNPTLRVMVALSRYFKEKDAATLASDKASKDKASKDKASKDKASKESAE